MPRLLTKGVYSRTLNKGSEHPFGLRNGQIWQDPLLRRAHWFNGLGEKLAVGDLIQDHLNRIKRDIPKDEIFVVMEQSVYMEAFQRLFGQHDMNQRRVLTDEPGTDFVGNHAVLLITTGEIMAVSPAPSRLHGADCEIVEREEAKLRLSDYRTR